MSDLGKNPTNANSSLLRGIWDIKVTTAFAPGKAVTVHPSFFSSSTITAPGSQNSGVPASETRAIFLPDFMSETN